jgi:hypothetical protein
MPGPKPITIKFAVEGLLASAGRGRWTGSVGRFEASGSRKPDVLADLRQQVERAVAQRDLGSVLRVGVADGEVHVLASRYDGRYEITRSPLPEAGMWSEPRHTGPDVESRVNAGDVFVDRLERAHEGRDRRPVSTAESALRTLAASVGVQVDADDSTVDWHEIAAQTARVFADARRETDGVQRFASESRALAELAGRGVTPEAQALARVLGLRGGFTGTADPDEVRREALAIVADMPGERFGGSLADARETRESALRALDALTKLDGLEDEIQLRIDNGELTHEDDLEKTFTDMEWPSNGFIDKAIAKAIEDDTLPDLTEKALAKHVAEKLQEAKDEWIDNDESAELAIRSHLRDALDAPERDDTIVMAREVCEALAKARIKTPIDLTSRRVRAFADSSLRSLRVYEKRHLHDIEGAQVYLGEDDLWHVDYRGSHATSSDWKCQDAVGHACKLVNEARAKPMLDDATIGDILDNAPRVRVWPLVGKGVHAVYDSSVGPLLSIETNDLETTLVSVSDVLAWGRGKYGPLDHLLECALTQNEHGDDTWACAPDCPAAVVLQCDALRGQLSIERALRIEVEDQANDIRAALDTIHEELDNRGVLRTLPARVRALLENA